MQQGIGKTMVKKSAQPEAATLVTGSQSPQGDETSFAYSIRRWHRAPNPLCSPLPAPVL